MISLLCGKAMEGGRWTPTFSCNDQPCTWQGHGRREADTHLLQVRVAPHLPIRKDPGRDAPCLIIFHPLRHDAPLDSGNVTPRGVGHINPIQPAAR